MSQDTYLVTVVEDNLQLTVTQEQTEVIVVQPAPQILVSLQTGGPGPVGPPGIAHATYPLEYNAGTQTVSTVQANTRVVTGDDSLNANDGSVLVNSSSPWTLALPDAASVAGNYFLVKNIGTAGGLIAASGGQFIDGALTAKMSKRYQSVLLLAAGGNWWVF